MSPPENTEYLVELLRNCLEKGHAEGWERFIGFAHPVVAGAVMRALARCHWRDRQVADDLIQDTFLRICDGNFRALRGVRAESSAAVRVWLRVVASNVVMSYVEHAFADKSGGAVEHVPIDGMVALDLPGGESPLEYVEGKIFAERVAKCLESHEARDRHIFWLYYRHGYSPRTIASQPGLELKQSGVETSIYRVTKDVRTCLKKTGQFRGRMEGFGA